MAKSKTRFKWIVCPECHQASYLIFKGDTIIKQACEGELPLVSEF